MTKGIPLAEGVPHLPPEDIEVLRLLAAGHRPEEGLTVWGMTKKKVDARLVLLRAMFRVSSNEELLEEARQQQFLQ